MKAFSKKPLGLLDSLMLGLYIWAVVVLLTWPITGGFERSNSWYGGKKTSVVLSVIAAFIGAWLLFSAGFFPAQIMKVLYIAVVLYGFVLFGLKSYEESVLSYILTDWLLLVSVNLFHITFIWWIIRTLIAFFI